MLSCLLLSRLAASAALSVDLLFLCSPSQDLSAISSSSLRRLVKILGISTMTALGVALLRFRNPSECPSTIPSSLRRLLEILRISRRTVGSSQLRVDVGKLKEGA